MERITVADRVRAVRGLRFVGRLAERELFRQAVEAPGEPPFTVLHVHGPGGIGKSALLRVFGDLAVAAGADVVRVDGRDVAVDRDAVRALVAPAVTATRRTVLLVDGYDLLAPLDGWLRDELLAELPSDGVVVLASRAAPAPGWTEDPGWRPLSTRCADIPATRSCTGHWTAPTSARPPRRNGPPRCSVCRSPPTDGTSPEVSRGWPPRSGRVGIEQFRAVFGLENEQSPAAPWVPARVPEVPMPTILGRHAVVLGASMAGLLTARVLTDAFEQVTLVERDELPTGPVDRRGVPQALQLHALLPRGNRILEELFPGLTRRAVADGAVTVDAGSRLRLVFGGHRLARSSAGDLALFASRLLLEHHVRESVRALPGVTVRDGCDVLRPVTDGPASTGAAVTGVEIRRHDGTAAAEVLAADLVVDATGRGSRTPVWLTEMGRTAPAEDRIVVDVGYVSGRFRLRPGALDGDAGVLVAACPGHPRGGGLFTVEDGEYTAGLAGSFGDHPPTDLPGFLDFAGTLVVPDLREAMEGAELLGPLRPARFPANVRRRYDRLTDLPERYLVVGDALCGFNPVYDQGMTIAAIEAELLRDLLAKGSIPAARTWFAAAIRALSPAWDLATGSDLLDPRVVGPRSPAGKLVNSYVGRFQAAAVHDAELARVFSQVSGMLAAPPTLMRPDRVVKVIWSDLRHRDRRTTPAPVPPRRVPG